MNYILYYIFGLFQYKEFIANRGPETEWAHFNNPTVQEIVHDLQKFRLPLFGFFMSSLSHSCWRHSQLYCFCLSSCFKIKSSNWAHSGRGLIIKTKKLHISTKNKKKKKLFKNAWYIVSNIAWRQNIIKEPLFLCDDVSHTMCSDWALFLMVMLLLLPSLLSFMVRSYSCLTIRTVLSCFSSSYLNAHQLLVFWTCFDLTRSVYVNENFSLFLYLHSRLSLPLMMYFGYFV